MTTGAQFANVTNKRLMSFVDMATRTIGYLRELQREITQLHYDDGAFLEKLPLSSPGANQVQVDAKPTEADYIVHDGDGHILDLQNHTSAVFENTAAVTYEVGAAFVAKPVEIDINPRTGKPDYDRWEESVGVQAEPNSVTDNGGNITFRVDSLNANGAEDMSGRTVRVFKKIPADGATSEAIAVEELTVAFGAGQNTITTSGLLGQATVSTTASDYYVQLVGLTVRRATNPDPVSSSATHFFAGTVLGNGGTPVTFDTTNQNIITNNLNQIAARSNWADATTNPADNLYDVLEKVITDLTSTTGGRGAAKLTAPAVAGVPYLLTAGTIADQLAEATKNLNTEALNRHVDVMLDKYTQVDTGAGDVPLALAGMMTAQDDNVPSDNTLQTVIAVAGDSWFRWSPDMGNIWHNLSIGTNVMKAVMVASHNFDGLNLLILAVGDAGRWQFYTANQSAGTSSQYSGTLGGGTPQFRQVVEDIYNNANADAYIVGVNGTYKVQFSTATTPPSFSTIDVSFEHQGCAPSPGRVVFYRPSDDRLYYADSPYTSLNQGGVVGMGTGSQLSSLIWDPDVGFILTENNSEVIYISADGTSVSSFSGFNSGQLSIMAFRFRERTYLKTERNVVGYPNSGIPSQGGRQLLVSRNGVFSTDPNDWLALSWPTTRMKGNAIAPGGVNEVGQNWNFCAAGGFMMEAGGGGGTYGNGTIAISRKVHQLVL